MREFNFAFRSKRRADIEEADWRSLDDAVFNARLQNLRDFTVNIWVPTFPALQITDEPEVQVIVEVDKLQRWLPFLSNHEPQVLDLRICALAITSFCPRRLRHVAYRLLQGFPVTG